MIRPRHKNNINRYILGEAIKLNAPLMAALEEKSGMDVIGPFAHWLELKGYLRVYSRYGSYPKKPYPLHFWCDTGKFNWPTFEYEFLTEKKWIRKAMICAGVIESLPARIGRYLRNILITFYASAAIAVLFSVLLSHVRS